MDFNLPFLFLLEASEKIAVPEQSIDFNLIFIFILAVFIGFELISKVPTTLHTPLMSGSNAISGITIVGALLIAGSNINDTLTIVIGTFAIAFAMINVVGGYLVTDRMLEMFKQKGQKK